MLAGFAKLLLLPCCTPSIALRASDDVNDYAAVVLSALRARTVRETKSAALAFREAVSQQRVMAPPLGGLGTISAHSYYHIRRIIPREITKYNTSCFLGFFIRKSFETSCLEINYLMG